MSCAFRLQTVTGRFMDPCRRPSRPFLDPTAPGGGKVRRLCPAHADGWREWAGLVELSEDEGLVLEVMER